MSETQITLSDAELAQAIGYLLRIGQTPKLLRDASETLSGFADALEVDAAGLTQLFGDEIAEDNPPPEPTTPPEQQPDEPIPDEPADTPFFRPFDSGGSYAWLPDAYLFDEVDVPLWAWELFEGQDPTSGALEILLGHGQDEMPNVTPRYTAGWGSDLRVNLATLGAAGSDEINPGVSAAGEHRGPLHYVRAFNATGTLEGFHAYRVGDFFAGREGHVVYLNATALPGIPTRVSRIVGVQHGGQLVQIVWRETEDGKPTGLPVEEWPENVPGSTLQLDRLVSIDGGTITEGNSVRASWPISIFTPGHERIEIEKVWVATSLPKPFKKPGKGDCRSQGALIVENDGKRPIRSGVVSLEDFLFDVTDPDSAVCRFGDVDEVSIDGGKIRERGKQRGMGFVSNVERVRIGADVDWSGPIRIFDPSNRWGSPRFVFEHQAGTVSEFRPTEYAS